MNILLTGASGFLGRHILKGFNEDLICTVGRSKTNDIICDLSNEIPNLPETELIIHAAGKAHSIIKTNLDFLNCFKVNVTGTENLLKGLDKVNLKPKYFVLISSVAVYGNKSGTLITEDHDLKANDCYGYSKILAEKLVLSWCKENRVILTILRLPLIAGKDAPGNLGDMVNAIKRGYYFNIGNIKCKKSIVLADDIPIGIKQAYKHGGLYNLTDGFHPDISDLAISIAKQLGKNPPFILNLKFIKLLSKIGDIFGTLIPINTDRLYKMTNDLTFDDSKARNKFSWNPRDVVSHYKIN
jgi:nucleoside-diphosphate-sugar epimerase